MTASACDSVKTKTVTLVVPDEPGVEQALERMAQELLRQRELWGQQDHGAADWNLIAVEEAGEAAEAAQDSSRTDLMKEIVQCAAVYVSWCASEIRGHAYRQETVSLSDARDIFRDFAVEWTDDIASAVEALLGEVS